MTNIRFAGAQIPCTPHLEKNINHIKNAINWARDNSVDYLLTPEGSLSGYFQGFDIAFDRSISDLWNAADNISKYAAEHNVGLCLGTMWGEPDETFSEGYRKENQIRFYSKSGIFLGKVNKTYTIPGYDQTVPSENIDIIDLHHNGNFFTAGGLLCNDFWGGPLSSKVSLPMYVAEKLNPNIIFHATNALRGEMPVYEEITDEWHNANLRMVSYSIDVPIITVDNSIKMNGTDYNGKTSSQSGILLNGEWKVKAPRSGTQYFYYDFDFEKFLNVNLYENPDQLILDNNKNLIQNRV